MRAFFRKYQMFWETIFLLLILAGGCLWKYQEYQLQQTQLEIAEKVLRFHVRANSDSREDQALKLKVRDAIGTLMQRRLVGVDQLDECSRIVNENLAEIIDTAEKTVRQEGYTYPVTAQVATVEFPQKTYGNYTFPAGAYQALNVVIGSGRGQNWWCVMYPNMCFHDAVYEVVDEEAEKSLQRVLSEDEYDAVLKSGKYRIRFKYLDFLNRFMK
ncbi:MAG: stage II sporulation protein R [Eubacterium sp.]|nr:stage II sporulation protein R [Eubacterium sp.]